LAAFWLWTAATYHFGHFSTINFAAPVYGVAFLTEGALLCWSGLLRGGLTFAPAIPLRRWAGLALITFAVAGLPLADLLAARHWPEIALAGTAPDPTALATIGFLLMAVRPARYLAVILVLWALASGATAWELVMWQGFGRPHRHTGRRGPSGRPAEAFGRGTRPMNPDTPVIESINAVTLATHDMARAVAFYQALGFPIHYGGRDAPFTSFRLGATHLNLIAIPAGKAIGWWGRLIFHVSDVDAVYTRALELGLRPDFAPRDADWGERYFHLRDPDGHELSFARPLGQE
jgi:catechol 2,3-dioxygenase-like lactoylglutathione lyase family enzyme